MYIIKMQFNDDILKLADSIGSFIEYWGFRKIDGRVWVLIYLSDEPIDAQALIHNFDVSKGLISTSIKTLMEYQLIEEIEHGDNRSKFYRAHEEPMKAILNVLKMREKRIISNIVDDFKALETSYDNINSKRLKSLGSLIKIGSKFLNQILKFKKLLVQD